MPDTTYIGRGIYTPRRATELVEAKPGQLKRWVSGYRRNKQMYDPVIDHDYPLVDGDLALSFLDLVELMLVVQLRKIEVPLQALRRAHDLAQAMLKTTHPFASGNLRTDGHDVFIAVEEEFGRSIVQATGSKLTGHHVMPEVVAPFLKHITFAGETALAHVLYPWGKDEPIVLDPQRVFGEPTVRETRIRTRTLADFVGGGASEKTVAEWYKLSEDTVHAAVRYESGHRWAA